MQFFRLPQTWHILAVSALIPLAWDMTGWDLPLAGLVASPTGFPLRHHVLLSSVLHDGIRYFAWLLVTGLCLAVWWPVLAGLARLPIGRRVQLALTPMLAGAVVNVLKAHSATSCPWDLTLFGGVARYSSHWSAMLNGGSGHCFPAGHAVFGFGFFGGYFAWRRIDARIAGLFLAGALACGLALGLVQQLRGAHFMSHTLWSAWTCWAVAWSLDAASRCFSRETV